jgi:Predicted flavin-nucleotide-binding protein
MERAIRRKDRAISEEEARALLEKCEYGFMATADGNGQPYCIPLSYIVMNNAVYFHCAPAGHKLDNIAGNPLASFSVVGATQPVFDGGFSTYYESAVVFGKVRPVMDDKEKREALVALVEKYLPEDMDKCDTAIDKSWSRTAVFAISMDRVTGKSKRQKSSRD